VEVYAEYSESYYNKEMASTFGRIEVEKFNGTNFEAQDGRHAC